MCRSVCERVCVSIASARAAVRSRRIIAWLTPSPPRDLRIRASDDDVAQLVLVCDACHARGEEHLHAGLNEATEVIVLHARLEGECERAPLLPVCVNHVSCVLRAGQWRTFQLCVQGRAPAAHSRAR